MRSLLFVPGDSPKKQQKGLDCGADALILDLEDSVALDAKPHARTITLEFLKAVGAQAKRPLLIVRINALSTGLTEAAAALVAARWAREAASKPPAPAEGAAAAAELFRVGKLVSLEWKIGVAAASSASSRHDSWKRTHW